MTVQAIDDATQCYIIVAQPVFNALLDGVRQMAALLILQAAGANKDVREHPMLAVLRDACAPLHDQVMQLKASPMASHFHRHLLGATQALHAGLRTDKSDHFTPQANASAEGALRAVKQALQQLTWASRALPGFETVAIGKSCCAECQALPLGANFSTLILRKHKG